MMPSISSSLLGGVVVFSAVAGLVGGVDRGVSSTVFMPADAAGYSIAVAPLTDAGRVSVADLALSSGSAVARVAFAAPQGAAEHFSAQDVSKLYFDPNPLTNVELPVWNVFRVGAQFQYVSKFKKAPAHAVDKPKAPSITENEKLPVGCDPMVSPVANRVLARIPVSCVSSNEYVRGDRKFAAVDGMLRHEPV